MKPETPEFMMTDCGSSDPIPEGKVLITSLTPSTPHNCGNSLSLCFIRTGILFDKSEKGSIDDLIFLASRRGEYLFPIEESNRLAYCAGWASVDHEQNK